MTQSLFRALLAASLCLAPLGWAVAQDQRPDDQQQRQDRQAPNQQRPPQQNRPPQGNSAPQGQHGGGPPAGGQGGGGQPSPHPAQNNTAPSETQSFQRPPQNNAPPPGAQSFQRPPSPPPGASASPAPPPGQSQFQRVQGPPQTGGGAPTGSAQQQQFQQRSGQRGGAPVGTAAPQAQPPQQQQTTVTRGNFQSGSRSANSATFTQHHGGAAPTQFDHGRFYGRDYGHFTSHEVALWQRGAWRHEFHDGRFGWWFAVDGIWYFYDQPIYPYPTFVPDVVYIPEEEDAPPDYADAPPDAEPPEQDDQPASYYYYFCEDTQTYYPYVTSCASSWLPVPAAPPQ